MHARIRSVRRGRDIAPVKCGRWFGAFFRSLLRPSKVILLYAYSSQHYSHSQSHVAKRARGIFFFYRNLTIENCSLKSENQNLARPERDVQDLWRSCCGTVVWICSDDDVDGVLQRAQRKFFFFFSLSEFVWESVTNRPQAELSVGANSKFQSPSFHQIVRDIRMYISEPPGGDIFISNKFSPSHASPWPVGVLFTKTPNKKAEEL